MTKKRTTDPWMPAPEYGRSLSGLGINLLVEDVARSVPFHRRVLGAEVVYQDPDIAVLRFGDAEWMLHAWHTYDAHPLYAAITSAAPRGIGAELRLHGRDPDLAEAEAIALGFTIVQDTRNKPHGLRECFIRDTDGYVWVPGIPY